MTPPLLSIESPFPTAHSMLRFLEPPGTSPNSLWERLLAGTYERPFIVDVRRLRFLHFDLDAVQSAMDLEYPERLCLSYTRKMMAFLLFNRAPERILLLGLGGGSLAKFCYRRLPQSRLTAVEKSPDVVSLREAFRVPDDDHRFRVVQTDGASYVGHLRRFKDVILADACDREGIAPELNTVEFYRDARRSLRRGGVLVFNLCGEAHTRAAHFLRIRQAFGDAYLTLPVRRDGNVIVFAFKDESPQRFLREIAPVASDLKRTHGLDFPRYLQRIALEWQRRTTSHLFA